MTDLPHETPAPLKVFTHHGRIGRLRYLAWTLLLVIAGMAAALVTTVLRSIVPLLVGNVLTALTGIAVMAVAFLIGARRLHDLGYSGWWWLLTLVPYIGGVLALLLAVLPGNALTNQYGPCPAVNSRAVKVIASMWLVMIAAVVVAGFMKDFQYLPRAH
ncbi:DUF805 domain-containing protein [Pseudomonas sp. nanlin1]|uniref:DUF805 domain-containing protein n=1 Tax=Pseudomonas sp. nanlin1 TaxID=3040605 RepID=UPI00388E2596